MFYVIAEGFPKDIEDYDCPILLFKASTKGEANIYIDSIRQDEALSWSVTLIEGEGVEIVL